MPGDGCDAECQREDGYVCDDAEPTQCHMIVCGDGLIDGNEECDDGAATPGDGCDSDCKKEEGFYCDPESEPTVCTVITILSNGAACDPESLTDICEGEAGRLLFGDR